jgi:RHS repeat-associated protein
LVAWTVGGTTRTAAYAYVQSPDLIEGYDIPIGTNALRARKTYEPRRDLITAVSNTWNFGPFSTFVYTNDALARRTRRVDNTGVTNDFGYNGRSELTGAQMGTNRFGYVYDPIGNRSASTNNAEVLTYLANSLNQYTNIADGVTNRLTYDLDGNMLTCGGWTFAWDGENRLLAASNGTTSVSFGYDHKGRRFRKIVAGATTTTNTFLYDGWAMVHEVQNGTTNAYVYGLDLSGSMQGAGTIGGLLCGAFGGTATVSSAFYAYDANGNVTALIDTNGAIAASYTYDPYGNTIAATGVLAAANSFRFSTKYLDEETGLYYYGYRYNAPGIGRWLNRDPIGEVGGLNLMCVCDNDTLNGRDPLGLVWTVDRSAKSSYAIAERTALSTDDPASLASDVNLLAAEAIEWARKDASGTPFSSPDELAHACKVYIPNRVLLLLPSNEEPKGWSWMPGYMVWPVTKYIRNRLLHLGTAYFLLKFDLKTYDHDKTKFLGPPTKSELSWPTQGIIMGGHGTYSPFSSSTEYDGWICLAEGEEFNPSSFEMAMPHYAYGLLYVHACFAGWQPWSALTSPTADQHIWSKWPGPAWGVPLSPTKPPKK